MTKQYKAGIGWEDSPGIMKALLMVCFQALLEKSRVIMDSKESLSTLMDY